MPRRVLDDDESDDDDVYTFDFQARPASPLWAPAFDAVLSSAPQSPATDNPSLVAPLAVEFSITQHASQSPVRFVSAKPKPGLTAARIHKAPVRPAPSRPGWSIGPPASAFWASIQPVRPATITDDGDEPKFDADGKRVNKNMYRGKGPGGGSVPALDSSVCPCCVFPPADLCIEDIPWDPRATPKTLFERRMALLAAPDAANPVCGSCSSYPNPDETIRFMSFPMFGAYGTAEVGAPFHSSEPEPRSDRVDTSKMNPKARELLYSTKAMILAYYGADDLARSQGGQAGARQNEA